MEKHLKKGDALREEIMRALRGVVERHARDHPAGESYKVSLLERGRQPIELQSDKKDFVVIEDVIEKSLPENVLRLARKMHEKEHQGEEFHMSIMHDRGLPEQVEGMKSAENSPEERKYEKKSAAGGQHVTYGDSSKKDAEAYVGCGCGFAVSFGDVLREAKSQDSQYQQGQEQGNAPGESETSYNAKKSRKSDSTYGSQEKDESYR